MTISTRRLVSVADSAKQLLGFPCTKGELGTTERKVLKQLAVALGKRASQMNDADLIDTYNSFDMSTIKDTGGDGGGEPTGEPIDGEPTGDTAKGKNHRFIKVGDDGESIDIDGEGSAEGKGETDENGNPLNGTAQGGQPKPVFEPQSPLEKELYDIIQRVHPTLDDGMHDGMDVDKVLAMIDEHSKVTMSGVADLIRKYAADTKPTTIEIKRGGKTISKPNGLVHEKLPRIFKALLRGDRVMLVGGAGSGKTYMAQQLQEMLGKAFKQKNYALGMTGSLFQAYEVKGYMDANGNYVESSFVKCFRDGGLMLFDEIDGSNPQALVALNASLENEQSDFPCGIVKRHKNFRIIACANTFGKGADREYVGRSQLDGATLDRFKPTISLDYDEKLERAIASDSNFTKIVQKLRKATYDLRIRYIISPRASISGGRALLDGETFEDVLNDYVLCGLDEDTKNRIRSEAGI